MIRTRERQGDIPRVLWVILTTAPAESEDDKNDTESAACQI
jgi:hypothetical protein